MPNVVSLVFIVQELATDQVTQRLVNTMQELKNKARMQGVESVDLPAETFLEQLARTPNGFEQLCRLNKRAEVRVVWRGEGKTAGLIYFVQDGRLIAITLLLSGLKTSNDVAAIDALKTELKSTSIFRNALQLVLDGGRPLIATFCDRSEPLTPQIDEIQMALATAVFHRCGLV